VPCRTLCHLSPTWAKADKAGRGREKQVAATVVQLVLYILTQQTRLQLQYDIYQSLYGKADFFQVWR
jgi:hypothetical protein